ncbi:MAG: hypothetical protein MUE37_13845 [Bacteroidales bacterium]|jgi:uncharacterized protein (TIGR02145 family)|nr:hypothetical protein [Bacteroidales bacterium]
MKNFRKINHAFKILLIIILSVGCKKNKETLPAVVTGTVTSITRTTASVSGEVTDNGGLDITSRGFCWGTVENPSTSGSKTISGSGTGAFSEVITDLSPSTTYYVRAYAINELGTAYGDQQSFTTGEIVKATLTTKAPGGVTSSEAISGGNITDDGGGNIIMRGICWNKTGSPTNGDSKTENGTGPGEFDSAITGLDAQTVYYARAYAVNVAGTAYGDEVTFTTDALTVTDIDGNEYSVVKIGTWIWMAENLATTKLNDGTKLLTDNDIPEVTSPADWNGLTTPAYCWYDNDKEGNGSYGALYNWYAVNTGKLCPAGWHVPTDTEWTDFKMYLIANGFNYDGDLYSVQSENKLAKALSAPQGWAVSDNTGAVGNDDYPAKINATGFSAKPSGYRHSGGEFMELGEHTYWWTSSDAGSGNAFAHHIMYFLDSFYYDRGSKGMGLSVRCLKDTGSE